MPNFNLVCPSDARALREENGSLLCDCGEAYPIVSGVPVLVKGVTISRQPAMLGHEVFDGLLDAFSIDPSCRPAIESVFDDKFSFVEGWMQTEADQFLHRVSASHEGLKRALKLGTSTPQSSTPINVNPTAQISSAFSISAVRPGTYFSVNLRVENKGTSSLSSDGDEPFMLSYHWHSSDGSVSEGHRTPLLDDLAPGRSFSVPIFIIAPQASGTYKLRIRALQEGVTWFEQSSIEYRVVVADEPSTVDDPKWDLTGKQFEYVDDHFEGIRKLNEWTKDHFDRPVEVVVEIGGNATPMIEHLDAPTKYNVDVDPYGMIIANLTRPRPVEFVIADGMALPMPKRSIDLLVMFATFHHFPDPVGLLSRLREYVTDDGLICLMCEPIGHVHRDTMPAEYLGEIRKGVNEQSFALWEYQQMFDAAELDVVAAQVDIGSAKIALRPKKAWTSN